MENEINISSEQIKDLMKKFSSNDKVDSQSTEKVIKDSLTPEQRDKINSILADPDRLKKILSSPQAKIIINMIKDKKE